MLPVAAEEVLYDAAGGVDKKWAEERGKPDGGAAAAVLHKEEDEGASQKDAHLMDVFLVFIHHNCFFTQ